MNLVSLKIFPTRTEAEFAKNTLDSYGIKGVLKSVGDLYKQSVGIFWDSSNLLVSEKDFQKAKEVLETYNKQ